MRVLLTGGSSLLGGGVARMLRQRGDDVTVFQRRPAGLGDGIREVLGDIGDASAVDAAAAGHDAVVHLAARVAITGAWPDFVAANIVGTANVVAAAGAAGVTRLVHVSSPSVAHMGSALVGAGAEPADPVRAHGFYARSKARAEQIALEADTPELRVVALRPHLVWGPGDTQLVARVVDRARSGRLAIVGRGAALVDSTYLDDAVTALVAGLDGADTAHGQALVVSSGNPRPIGELLTRMCLAAGAPPPTRHVPFRLAYAGGALLERLWSLRPRDDEPPMTRFLAEQLATAHWFDQRRTREVLRWRPHVGIDEGFARLAAWYAAQGPA